MTPLHHPNVLQTQAGGVERGLLANRADPAMVVPGDADGEMAVGGVHASAVGLVGMVELCMGESKRAARMASAF